MPDFGVHIGKSMGKPCKSQIQTARAPKGQPPLCGITAIEPCVKPKCLCLGCKANGRENPPLILIAAYIAGLCGPQARRTRHGFAGKDTLSRSAAGARHRWAALACSAHRCFMQGYGKAFRTAQNKQGTGRFPVRKKPGSAIKQSPARETDLRFSYFAYSTARLSRITFTLIWPG